MFESLHLILSSYETRYSDLSVFLSKDENEFYIYILKLFQNTGFIFSK